jgi:adenylate cyclase
MIGTDEEGTLNRLRSIRAELIDPKITEHRGRTVKTTGDGLLVEFSSVVDALRCATQWQDAMAERNAAILRDYYGPRLRRTLSSVLAKWSGAVTSYHPCL